MDRKLLIAPLLILLALIAAGPVAAQSTADVTAFIELRQEAQYFVGDQVELKLTVTHPADHHVIFPELEEEWGEFILKDQSAPLTVDNDNGTKFYNWCAIAYPFCRGKFCIDALLGHRTK